MRRRIMTGILIGAIAGLIDIIPMIWQKLTWDADISAFLLWVVVGFMIATSNLRWPGVIKGIVVSFLCLLPSVFIIGGKEPFSLLPIFVMTLILGTSVGYAFHKLVKE